MRCKFATSSQNINFLLAKVITTKSNTARIGQNVFRSINCHVCVIALRHIHVALIPSCRVHRTNQGEGMCRVYVRNLEERVKLEPLKEALKLIFAEYGNVIDIIAKRNLKAKGQAFVVFDRPESAAQAVEELQGFELFEKPIQIALARTRSDATVKKTGNREEFELHQRRRMAEKGSSGELVDLQRRKKKILKADTPTSSIDKKKAAEAAEEQKRLKRPGGAAPSSADAGRPTKAARSGLKPTAPAGAGGPNAVVPDEYLPPNKILFVQNLPDDYHDIDALGGVFGRFEGFREVRLVPGRKGIAFIEYEAEAGAITAKENTAGMSLGDKFIKVTYQRQ